MILISFYKILMQFKKNSFYVIMVRADQNQYVNSLSQKQYEIANASLFYQKKNSAWGFEASATNFLNNGVKRTNSFSDYLISERTTYILPRIFLVSVNYKL